MYNPYIQITIVLSSIFLYQVCLGLDADPLTLMGQTSNAQYDYADYAVQEQGRRGRTLINQFPFNQGSLAQLHGGNHGGHHGTHHGTHQGHGSHGAHGFHNGFPQLHQGFNNDGRFSRQGAVNGNGIENVPVDLGTVAAAGERCVEKVMMIEETKYDDAIECHHSYDQQCHTTYTTDYVPQQVEDCDENFVKECFIEYYDKAFNETVEICNEIPVRDCLGREGPIECETVYETECATTYHLHEVEEDSPNCKIQMMEKCREVTQGYSTKEECDKWPQQVCELEKKVVKKYSPETQCKQLPRELCGPGACPVRAGPKQCRNEIKTIVQEVPKERCSLRAQPYCEFETKLVPVLKPVENCVDVPKEVCVRMRTNPRKVKRPVIKKWCYVPTEESGLITTERPAPTTTIVTTTATETGRSFESTPGTLYGAPPIPVSEPPQLYGAPPTEKPDAQGYGAVPQGTLDTSYTAALPPPIPTKVEKARRGSFQNGSRRRFRGRNGNRRNRNRRLRRRNKKSIVRKNKPAT